MRCKYCDDCVYLQNINGDPNYTNCGYILMTNHKRPCPPGEGCTVKVAREVHRRKRRSLMTQEELEQRNRERRAYQREYYQANKERRSEYYAMYREKNKAEINRKAREKREKAKEAKGNG